MPNPEPLSIHVNGISYDFSFIETGSFLMGSASGLPLELPVHDTRITSSFYISRHLVSQRLWLDVMGFNPARFITDDANPVESITWLQAKEFCQRLQKHTDKTVRLPSEAEWEYVCRAGTNTEYFFATDAARLNDYAWFDLNARDTTHAVGQKQPNPWMLYDIVGNVWEWCEDDWVDNYVNGPVDQNPMLHARANTQRKAVRGGSYDLDAFRCRCAYRSFEAADFASSKIGFRIVLC